MNKSSSREGKVRYILRPQEEKCGEERTRGRVTEGTVLLYYGSSEVHQIIKATVLYKCTHPFYPTLLSFPLYYISLLSHSFLCTSFAPHTAAMILFPYGFHSILFTQFYLFYSMPFYSWILFYSTYSTQFYCTSYNAFYSSYKGSSESFIFVLLIFPFLNWFTSLRHELFEECPWILFNINIYSILFYSSSASFSIPLVFYSIPFDSIGCNSLRQFYSILHHSRNCLLILIPFSLHLTLLFRLYYILALSLMPSYSWVLFNSSMQFYFILFYSRMSSRTF